jgi:hypothetical protein
MIARRTAIKNDLFAVEQRAQKAEALRDPLQKIAAIVDFRDLAEAVDRIAPRPVQAKGGRPPYPTEVMIRILVVKRLHGLSEPSDDAV